MFILKDQNKRPPKVVSVDMAEILQSFVDLERFNIEAASGCECCLEGKPTLEIESSAVGEWVKSADIVRLVEEIMRTAQTYSDAAQYTE